MCANFNPLPFSVVLLHVENKQKVVGFFDLKSCLLTAHLGFFVHCLFDFFSMSYLKLTEGICHVHARLFVLCSLSFLMIVGFAAK